MMHRILSFTIIACLLVAVPAVAAVAREGTPVECVDAAAADTTFSCTMTIGSVSNGLLLCGLMSNDNVDINPTVVWDPAGVNESLTQVTNAENSASRYQSLWYRKNPTAGSSKLVTVSSASSAARDGMICAFYSGVDQTTSTDCTGCSSSGNVDIVTGAGGTSIANSATVTSGSGEILFACIAKANSEAVTWDTASGNAEIHQQSVGAGGLNCADDIDGADDVMSGDWTTNASFVIMTVNLNADGGAAPANAPKCLLLGVCEDDSTPAAHAVLPLVVIVAVVAARRSRRNQWR